MEISPEYRIEISAVLSQRLRVFGFVSALLIVLIHSTPNPVVDTWQWWFAELLGRDGLCRIAVPYFFLAGGFFLAGHVCEMGWWRREVNKRVRTLAIPYFLWIGIGLLVHLGLWFGIQIVGKVCGFPNPFYGPMHIWFVDSLGINPFTNKIGILWFVRDLFALIVISPFLIVMLKRFKFFFIAIIFVLYGVVTILQLEMDNGWYNFFEYFISLRGLCYFAIGLWLRYEGMQICHKSSRMICLWGWVILMAKIVLLRYSYLKAAVGIDIIMVPILMVGLFNVLCNTRFPTWITDNTFALYLIRGNCKTTKCTKHTKRHSSVFTYFRVFCVFRGSYRNCARGFATASIHQTLLLFSIVVMTVLGLRNLMNTSIVIWLTRFVFAAFVSIAIALGVRRFFPRLANLLFGGR